MNSVFITFISVTAIVILSAMASYSLTRFKFKGQKLLILLFVSGLMLPQVLVIIPLFNLLDNLLLLDSYFGLFFVYVAFSFPFTIFTLLPFFKSIPKELEEAAIIDGCSHLQIFKNIALPLVKPGIIIVTIFNIFGIWNEYVFALSIISTEKLYTLPVGISKLIITQQYQSDWGASFAALIIATLPVLLTYIIFSRNITESIMSGGIKG